MSSSCQLYEVGAVSVPIFQMRKRSRERQRLFPKVVHDGTRILAFQLMSLGSQPLWVSVSSASPATLAMDQPAGLQVDYIFRGVEHAVRVTVSGQVLELEVEDRMTADQWRGEFDASCEYACLGGIACPSPESVSPRR